MVSNIWVHWKTSAAGLLVAVTTITGVFLAQGVTLGNLGTGTVISLIAGCATALLGLLARDPAPGAAQGSASSTQKLGVVMLCGLTLLATVPMSGCNVSAAQLQADGQQLATAVATIATSLQATNPAAAAQLQTIATGLAALASNWTGATAEQQLNAFAAAAEAVMATIPPAAPYAAMVAVAVTVIDFILANTTAPASAALEVRATAPSTYLATYRSVGKTLVHHRMLRSHAGDFKAAWATAAAH